MKSSFLINVFDQLWSQEGHSPHQRDFFGCLSGDSTAPNITEFYFLALDIHDQNVLGLNIAVCQPQLLQDTQGIHQSLHDLLDLTLGEDLPRSDPVLDELLETHHSSLHYDVCYLIEIVHPVIPGGAETSVVFYDGGVGLGELLENLDLSGDLGGLLLAFDDDLLHGCWPFLEFNSEDHGVACPQQLLDLDILEMAVAFLVFVGLEVLHI